MFHVLLEILSKEKIEFIKFNELCNIGNFKWVLGDPLNFNIEVQDFEGKTGCYCKINRHKKWLIEFDISSYFNLDETIDELVLFNLNIVKDE